MFPLIKSLKIFLFAMAFNDCGWSDDLIFHKFHF